jgi:hypothetical protein
LAKTPQAQPTAPTHAAPTAKLPPRDSAFSVYNNPDYGVSFRYPRTYSLDDPAEDTDEASSIETQKSLDIEQPGSVLVATVEIPSDAYPRTTFVSGTLQFITNKEISTATCHSFVIPDEDGYTTGSVNVEGVKFDWQERVSAAAGTSYHDRDYAVFANGACYEFRLEVVSSNVIDPDFPLKPADTSKILHQLEKIVTSTKFYPTETPGQNQ